MRNDSGQASLIKVVVGLAVAALLFFDLGRPMVARVQLDTKAHETALASADKFKQTSDEDEARVAAEEHAALYGAVVTEWSIRTQDQTVTLSLERTVDSWIFGRFLKSWYLIKATASERPG